FFAAQPAPATVAYLGAALVYAIGSIVCHQLPGRSFHLWGRQLPVCARCTGIYLGAAVAVLASAIADRQRAVDRARQRGALGRPAPGLRPLLVMTLAALPTAATLVFEWTTGITPANWVRAAAGLALGAAAAWLAARGLAANPEVN